jgi:NAD(P)H-dependent flavin oxidoreductase YrpB (nitropropane dioxygenase family)
VLDAVADTGMPVVAAGGSSTAAGWPPRCPAPRRRHGDPFLLTSDSTVPDEVKQRYLASALDGTVVSTRVDGMPHRVRTGLVEKLESGSRYAVTAGDGNAQKFKKMTGMTWRSMIRDGMAMRHGKD